MEEQKVLLVDDAQADREKAAKMLLEIDRINLEAKGKVRLSSGEVIDRVNIGYKYRELAAGHVLAHDGVQYTRSDKGTLRRITPKHKERLK